ncbi:MAG TPA: protein translocase subunit SecD [Candidatus Dormibacteraeota bacterium]|nr:protein translocase subunit SecD [Candidatus Dormibacteraeota bacterium]
MRINRYVAAAVAVVALAALFVDGYSYVYRWANHIPLSARLATPPNLLGRDVYIHKGLDLQGGTEIVLEIDPTSIPKGMTMSVAQDSTVQVMQRRVNGIGVNEVSVQAQGANRVVVQLPGVDFDRAVTLIGKTAKLTLRTWLNATPGPDGKIHVKDYGDEAVSPKQVPPGELVDLSPKGPSAPGNCVASTSTLECIPTGAVPHYFGLDGSMIQTASVGVDQTTGQPTVDFTLNDQGTTLLANASQSMPSATAPLNLLAIYLDDQMINDATVQQPLTNGSVQISGGNVSTDANYRNDLAATLNAGRLPGKISIVEANSVGATLGFDSVRRGLEAGALGLAVVVLFMVAYYRMPGVVASLALALYALITLALYKLIPVTLTLAGLAGFVLSVGMAVDANVLIFERLREELRNGRSLAAAVEAARDRAFPAIRDSNISTLITCAVLFFHDRFVSSGFTLAKGFALTLGLGVVISFFSAVIVTHLFLQVAIRFPSLRRAGLFAVEKVQ